MGFQKIILGLLLSTIGFVSFATQSSSSQHTPLAYLLPFVTSAPTPKETAQFIPTRSPSPTEAVQVLGYKTAPLPTKTPVIPTVVPTRIPTSVPAQPTIVPTVVPVSETGSSAQAFIMQALNDYRHANGLGSVTTNSSTCSFAATRAQEITTNFSHDGFTSRLNAHTLPYPNFSLVTENIAETGNYQDVVNLWANSPEHAANMRADTPYICVAQNGNYYAMEGWKSL